MNRIHGDGSIIFKVRLYAVWTSMKDRCFNPRCTRYKHYGGRGIRVCARWRHNYIAFRQWALNNGYTPALRIERIDNDKGYYPSNCKWATTAQQNRNRSVTRLITFRGQTLCAKDWADIGGMNPSALLYRLNQGWGMRMAMNTPIVKRAKPTRKTT